ncbi:MAG: LamG domain-containing protein, partial [Planctomycetota bacterium]
MAYWTFDEDSGRSSADASGNGYAASPEGRARTDRASGVFGNAVSFAGRHTLRVPGKPDFANVKRISLAAWVMPTAFERYNEIFRKEDGSNRVLFSFQENGTVLSLGLNVGGYVECDARIRREELLDGWWHHCAATFDGKVMRVYLDGAEIGSLDRNRTTLMRSSTISAGGAAPGCIGSMNGVECFQGSIDELRIYSEALTAEEVVRLYRNGLESLKGYKDKLEEQLRVLSSAGSSFAETLSAWRKELVEKRVPLSPKLARAARRKLAASFGQDYKDFARLTETDPIRYLTARDHDINEKLARRFIGPLVEYKPLTEDQWKRLTPEDLKKWREVEAVDRKFTELAKLGAAARFSPEWIDGILRAGRGVRGVPARPSKSEAV